MAGRPKILLEANVDRIREVAAESADVVDIGAAPAVDRLVIVADDEHTSGVGRQRLQPCVLCEIDVLIFVGVDPVELAGPGRAIVGVVDQSQRRPEEEIAEVSRVGLSQAGLIFRVDLGRHRQSGDVDGSASPVPFGDPVFYVAPCALRRHEQVFEFPDVACDDFDRVAFAALVLVARQVHRLHDPAKDTAGIVGVEDVEIVAQRCDFWTGAQLASRQAVKRA